MKNIIAFISHNRLDYTQKSLMSLLETSDEANDLIIAVDNASTDGTVEWLDSLFESDEFPHFGGVIGFPDNKYPGYSANKAWEVGLQAMPDATHLMRSDNDLLYSEGWRGEAEKAFDAMPTLGQLGTMSQVQCFVDDKEAQKLPHKMPVVEHSEGGHTVNTWWTSIGGPCIIRRDLWDMGLRYDQSPWSAVAPDVPTPAEDVKLSLAIRGMGYFFANMLPDLVTEMSFGNTDDYFDYYSRTFQQRGHGIPARTKNGKTLESGKMISTLGKATDHI